MLLLADVGAVAMLYTLWSTRPLWSDIALLLVLIIATAATWKGTLPPRHLSLPALAFLGAFVLSAVFAPDTLTAWRSVLGVAAYGLVFLLLGNLLAQGVTRGELYLGLVIAAQVLMAAWAANWLMDGAPLIGYRLRYDNTNSAALSVLLLMPALIVGERRRLMVGQSAAVLWLSASRAGALGLAAAMGTAVLRRSTLARQRWVLVVLAGAVGLGLLGRSDLLAEQMVAASPLVGQGPNAYKGWWLAADDSLFYFGHAHNLALNLLAETGWVGLAAGAWLIVALLWVLARRRRSLWALAALAATVGLLAHSLGDVPTTQPYITVTWLALVRMGLAD